MKIKGPSDYSGPPTPPEPKGVDNKSVSKFETEQTTTESTQSAGRKEKASGLDSFETGLREIAKTSGPQGMPGEAVDKIVDTVLQEVLGKDFMSRPDAARLKEAIAPLISQDEQIMGKLQSILNRLGNPEVRKQS